MKRLCIFCGASSGVKNRYTEVARELGLLLVKERIELVYGGGGIGLMGEISDSVMKAGGRVIGIIPDALVKMEVAHKDISDLRVVSTMHERKAMMAQLSDGFIAMPGGMGTLEEFAEVVTWAQLSFHRKPCGLLNVEHYFDHLITFLDHAMHERFLKQEHRELIIMDDDPARLIERMRAFKRPGPLEKMID